MQAPKFPSFFKSSANKSFSFTPRYYDERKERREQLKKGTKANIKFKRKHIKKQEKVRGLRIALMIIVLSLLFYKLIIN